MFWYILLNYFFFVFHTAFTVFNMFGWMFYKTRRWNLVTLLLTAFSWFVMGIWYGWGYCICTDCHWDVRKKMGFNDESNSYIHFLLLKLTGKNFDAQLVEQLTLIGFIISFVASILLNIKDYKKRKRAS